MEKLKIENYSVFVLPGILVLVTFSSCGSGGILNYIMKANGSFYRILVSPIGRGSIILGQILEAILLSFVEAATLTFIGLFFSGHIDSGIFGIFIMVWILCLTVFLWLGYPMLLV